MVTICFHGIISREYSFSLPVFFIFTIRITFTQKRINLTTINLIPVYLSSRFYGRLQMQYVCRWAEVFLKLKLQISLGTIILWGGCLFILHNNIQERKAHKKKSEIFEESGNNKENMHLLWTSFWSLMAVGFQAPFTWKEIQYIDHILVVDHWIPT